MTKPRSFAPIIAAVLLLLPVLYVGSYFALVVPEGIRVKTYRGYSVIGRHRVSSADADILATRIFWPLEQIDQRLRPSAWDSAWDDAPNQWYSGSAPSALGQNPAP